MKKLDNLPMGMIAGLITPVLAFIIYFRLHDPELHLKDAYDRLVESGVLTYYLSLCALANLLMFFLFLRIDADRAARGVLGATIIYAFTILFLKLS